MDPAILRAIPDGPKKVIASSASAAAIPMPTSHQYAMAEAMPTHALVIELGADPRKIKRYAYLALHPFPATLAMIHIAISFFFLPSQAPRRRLRPCVAIKRVRNVRARCRQKTDDRRFVTS